MDDVLVIPVESEIELQRILDALDSQSIPYSVKRYDDTAFPSLGQVKPLAEISVSKSFEQAVTEIVANTSQMPLPIRNGTSVRSKFNLKLSLLIIYCLAITLVAIRYWYILDKTNHDKNFEFEWNIEGTHLRLINKKTGKSGSLYVDENQNYSFEEIITYSNDGFMITRSLDANEDGRYERFLNYNLDGALVIDMKDADDDGVVDGLKIFLQNKDTLILTDKNKDGFFEVSK